MSTPAPEAAPVAAAPEAAPVEGAEKIEGAEALGDPGKKALDAMKADRNAARARAQELEARLAELEAKAQGREAEHAATIEAQRVRDEALSAANQRILKAEIRAAAAGKLADPADALRFIDLSSLEVGDDGATDAAAIAAAIEDLIKAKPYLSTKVARFEGGADGGVRNGQPADLQSLITEASKSGNHVLAIALKRQLSALTK